MSIRECVRVVVWVSPWLIHHEEGGTGGGFGASGGDPKAVNRRSTPRGGAAAPRFINKAYLDQEIG